MQPVLRLKRHVTELLQPYDSDPNRAIESLYNELISARNELKTEKAVTKALQETIQNLTKPPTIVTKTLQNAFIPASSPSLRTIGKIDPDEKLDEPIGMRGKSL